MSRFSKPSRPGSPPPVPPVPLPPARTVYAPGRGELFLRDTGGDGPPVMLLHGWMASADLNWWCAYAPLVQAGYRVIAIDHRGHGRGLRSIAPFSLSDCATDAAAALDLLGAAPATVVGYSMGGAIAQLVARDHPDLVSGLVLSGTADSWHEPRERRFFRAMGVVWLLLALAPNWLWRHGLHRSGVRDPEMLSWMVSELLRASARDLAEAGRELGRFDSRAWISSLPMPAVVAVTSKDTVVAPRKQRRLAAALGALVLEAPIDHLDVVKPSYAPMLLRAVEALAVPGSARAPRALHAVDAGAGAST